MVPTIGFMIAAYTIPRLLTMLIPPQDGKTNSVVNIVTAFALLATVGLCIALYSESSGKGTDALTHIGSGY